jgi:hypothetical protein
MGWLLAWAGSLPMPVYYVLAAIGAVAGFIYGLQQPHQAQYFYALAGGTVGFILIPAIAMIVRFIVQVIILGLFGLAFYYAFFKP